MWCLSRAEVVMWKMAFIFAKAREVVSRTVHIWIMDVC